VGQEVASHMRGGKSGHLPFKNHGKGVKNHLTMSYIKG